MSADTDKAVVIGGGVSGLVAATLLAKSGLRTSLLEARDVAGGICVNGTADSAGPSAGDGPLLYALDPTVVSRLNLPRHGFRLALRDMPLVALRPFGEHLSIGRDVHATARAIARRSRPDGRVYPRFRHAVFSLARALRPLWWDGRALAAPDSIIGRHTLLALENLKRQSVSAMMDAWFESPALKAALGFDAATLGMSAYEPPTAAMYYWRVAQEMGGLQGAVAMPVGGCGALVRALLGAARAAGVEIRTTASVSRLVLDQGRVSGAVLASGEEIAGRVVLSSLSRRRSSALLQPGEFGLARATRMDRDARLGEARIVFGLDSAPEFGDVPKNARYVVADRLDALALAHEAARAGQLSEELCYEAYVSPPSAKRSNEYGLSVRVRPVPVEIDGGWPDARVKLIASVVSSLSAFDRRIKDRIKNIDLSLSFETMNGSCADDGIAMSVDRLVSTARDRIQTSVPGLFLCGRDAEPVTSVSGRAARQAADLAIAARSSVAGGP